MDDENVSELAAIVATPTDTSGGSTGTSSAVSSETLPLPSSSSMFASETAMSTADLKTITKSDLILDPHCRPESAQDSSISDSSSSSSSESNNESNWRRQYPFPTETQMQRAKKNWERRVAREQRSGEKLRGDYPSTILDGWLYLGNRQHSSDWAMLKQLGISHVLNVSEDLPNYFALPSTELGNEYGLRYANITVADVVETDLSEYFESAADFIDECNPMIQDLSDFEHPSLKKSMIELQSSSKSNDFNNNKPAILVHCAVGVSRSATIMTAYLMSRVPIRSLRLMISNRDFNDIICTAAANSSKIYSDLGARGPRDRGKSFSGPEKMFTGRDYGHCPDCGKLSLHDAFYFVSKRRPIVAPNRAFKKQLVAFESLLHQECEHFSDLSQVQMDLTPSQCCGCCLVQ